MAMVLDKVVPFGRSMDEYIKMFSLTDADLNQNIIGIGDGPASFNAQMTRQGKNVVSLDPLYQFNADEILQRFNAVVDDIINQVKASPGDWDWSYHQSPENLRRNRVQVITEFLSDYETGKQNNRYIIGELPRLAFANQEFDLALCSHFLFLYSDHLDYNFHLASVGEMLRIAKEVRIFPLLTLMLQPSPYLEGIIQHYTSQGYEVEIKKVGYSLQRGGNQMMRIGKRG
ncbi:hypothetical protein [Fortiea contorta]|uniref:hypothetical protein n=1 Tax=Fortiea contorta TaxID=1892405 RepID=UPI00034D96C5|nr:hypothetical protein [Fortiea contorta]